MRKRQNAVEDVCDEADYPGSPIYDEYPDRETLYGLCGRAMKRACEYGLSAEESDAGRDMMLILLVCEIGRRRLYRRA